MESAAGGPNLQRGISCGIGADAAPGVQRRWGIGNGGSIGAGEAAATGQQLLPRRNCSLDAAAAGVAAAAGAPPESAGSLALPAGLSFRPVPYASCQAPSLPLPIDF